MRILVLGQGKTGKLVAAIAAERGHGVHVLDAKENANAAALTPPFVAGFDVVIDFTAPGPTSLGVPAWQGGRGRTPSRHSGQAWSAAPALRDSCRLTAGGRATAL